MENNTNKTNTIKDIGNSDFVMMGPVRLRQPLPTQQLNDVDPFVLLHHYGPYEINRDSNPFDLGPHPHRGFEPVTFLIQGEQLHRDSLGNESVVKAGDVQWTTAGRGIVHAEGPKKEFVEKGGTLEGIQLWVNLPSSKKLIPANYQHVKNEDFKVVTSDDGLIATQVIAGRFNEQQGKIKTQTPITTYMIAGEKGGTTFVPIQKNENALLYLLHGDVIINGEVTLKKDAHQLVTFNADGTGFELTVKEDAKLLFLSGAPFNEKVVSWGPYVMNSQTEILEALRDFQQGKMGFLPN